MADADQHCGRRRQCAAGMGQRLACVRPADLAARGGDHVPGEHPDDHDRNAHLHRHRLVRDRRRRDGRRTKRYWLFHLERVEQPAARQHDRCDCADRPRRARARFDAGLGGQATELQGMRSGA